MTFRSCRRCCLVQMTMLRRPRISAAAVAAAAAAAAAVAAAVAVVGVAMTGVMTRVGRACRRRRFGCDCEPVGNPQSKPTREASRGRHAGSSRAGRATALLLLLLLPLLLPLPLLLTVARPPLPAPATPKKDFKSKEIN